MADLMDDQFTAIASVDLGVFIPWNFPYGLLYLPTSRYCATQGGSVSDNLLPTGYVYGTLPEYGLMGAYPSTMLGSVRAVTMQDGLLYVITNWSGPGGYVCCYLQTPADVQLQTGQTLEYKALGVNSQLDAPYGNTYITNFAGEMGLSGTPSDIITPAIGSVTDTHYIAQLAAQNYGFSGTVQFDTTLMIDLPVLITGLNPNRDAGIRYQGTNTLTVPIYTTNQFGQLLGSTEQETGIVDPVIHIPVLSDGTNVGTGMLQIDANAGTKTVYIGNLLICDNPNIILTLTNTQAGTLAFVANNPTDSQITCTVQNAPGFTLLGTISQQITLRLAVQRTSVRFSQSALLLLHPGTHSSRVWP